MPRRTTKKSTRKRTQRGKGVKDVLNFIRNNHLASRGLGLIPHPAAQAVSSVAGLIGLGRRRRSRRSGGVTGVKRSSTSKRGSTVKVPNRRRRTVTVMRGRGIFSDLGGGIGNVFGGFGSGVGSIAHGLFGSGRKKSTRRRGIAIR